jgi:hypothetical protein
VLFKVLRRRPRATVGLKLPETLTPFTVTMLLRRVQQTGKLSPADKETLDGKIDELEQHYFAGVNGNGEITLRTLAEDWVRRVR